MTQVAIQRCGDYEPQNAQRAVGDAVALLGGIEKFVKPGQKVLLKPNILSARPPEDGVCTHPEVVRAVIRLVKKITDNVYVGDSHGGFDVMDMDKIYEASGIKKVCQEEDIRLVKFDTVEYIDSIPFAEMAVEADVIIDVPKMKTHSLLTLTGAVKNMFGTVVGKYKAECHFNYPSPEDFCSNLIKIFSHVRPTLAIMDGVVAMEGDGPASGQLRNVGLILASADAVALDTVFAELVGLGSSNFLTTLYANRTGVGTGRFSDIELLGESFSGVKIKDFVLPQTSIVYKLPAWVIRLLGNLVRSRPFIEEITCVQCRICGKNCPVNAIDIDRYHIDYSKCIYCFCCHELCPKKSIIVQRPFMGRMLKFIINMRNLWRSER